MLSFLHKDNSAIALITFSEMVSEISQPFMVKLDGANFL